MYAKAENVPTEHAGEWGYGDVWTRDALKNSIYASRGIIPATMRVAGNDFNRSELAGAFGDLGTLIPDLLT